MQTQHTQGLTDSEEFRYAVGALRTGRPMTASTYVILRCDQKGCNTKLHTNKTKATDARKWASKLGWTRTNKKDSCHKHG